MVRRLLLHGESKDYNIKKLGVVMVTLEGFEQEEAKRIEPWEFMEEDDEV